MAYISTDDVKHIRNELKKELPQYKFSVVRDHHSSVTISLMKASAFKDFEYFDRYAHETKTGTLNDGHHQINQYHLEDFYGKENAKSWTRFMLSQKLLLLRMVEKSGTMIQMQ